MLVWNKQWEMQSVRAFSGVWWAYGCLWIYFQYTEMLDFSYSSINLWTSRQLIWILSLDHVGFSGLVGWGRQERQGITSSWGDSSWKGPLEVMQHQDTPRPGGWPCRVKPGLCPRMEIPWYLCDLSFIGIFFPLVSNKDFSHVRWCSIISSDRVPSIPRAITQCNGEITALTCLPPPVTAAWCARCPLCYEGALLTPIQPGVHLILHSCFPALWHQRLAWRNTREISEGWMLWVVKKICSCFISRWTPSYQEAQLGAWIQTSYELLWFFSILNTTHK